MDFKEQQEKLNMDNRNIAVLGMFFCYCVAYAQVSSPVKDTSYFDQDMIKTKFLEDAKTAKVCKRDAQGKILGTVRYYYLPSWAIMFEGKLQSENPDIISGKCTFYYQNGNVKSTGTYENGIVQNDNVEYRETGGQIDCKDSLVELVTQLQKKLPAQFETGNSRVYIKIPTDVYKKIVLQFQIQDESSTGEMDFAISLFSAYSVGASAFLSGVGQGQSQKGATKNFFFITKDYEEANYFFESKGKILNRGILYYSENSAQEMKMLNIPEDIEEVYFCVQNNNYKTSAICFFDAVGVTRVCK